MNQKFLEEVDKLIEHTALGMQQEAEHICQERFRKMKILYAELQNSLTEKRSGWLRYLVSTVVVVFGILVSLGRSNDTLFLIRCFFVAGVVFLALSSLFLLVAAYSEIYYRSKGNSRFLEEMKKDILGSHKPKDVDIPKQNSFLFCEIAGYICFALALLALCVYMLLLLLLG